ncbi:hypothetical protein D3C84_914770 [compost metagenome]
MAVSARRHLLRLQQRYGSRDARTRFQQEYLELCALLLWTPNGLNDNDDDYALVPAVDGIPQRRLVDRLVAASDVHERNAGRRIHYA